MKIDLTKIGHDENIAFEVANKDKILAQKYPEAHLEEGLPEIVQNPPPDWIAPRDHRPWWKIFNLLVI